MYVSALMPSLEADEALLLNTILQHEAMRTVLIKCLGIARSELIRVDVDKSDAELAIAYRKAKVSVDFWTDLLQYAEALSKKQPE